MIIKLALTFLLSGIVIYALVEYRRSPVVSTLSMLASLVGIYLTWIPVHASELAALVGVGRGVDLIIYTWVVISLLVLLNLHLKLRVQLELITVLARRIAIQNAEAAQAAKAAADAARSSPQLEKA